MFDERLAYNYGFGNYNSVSYHSNAVNGYMQAGMAFDIAKKMQLELLLNNLLYAGYSQSTSGNSYNISTSLEGFSFSNIAFGFRCYVK